MSESRVHVGPEGSSDFEAIRSAVLSGGGTVVPLEDANALVWLGKANDKMDGVLHDGIEWVQIRGAGVEAWLSAGKIDRNRIFTGAQGAYSSAVAEHAVALLLAASKRLPEFSRAHRWDRSPSAHAQQLRGRTLSIVGCGGIGREVIRLLAPFGLDIIAVTRSGREVAGASRSLAQPETGEVWGISDFVLLAAPMTAATNHLVGRAELEAMRPEAWIINVGRGGLIDTAALVEALDDEAIGGAALDVTDPEPLPAGHPLWKSSRCLITPHVANPHSALLDAFCRRVEENVRRFATGSKLVGVVDVDAGY